MPSYTECGKNDTAVSKDVLEQEMQLPLACFLGMLGVVGTQPPCCKEDRLHPQLLVDALTAPAKVSANSSHQLPDMSEESTDDSSPQLMLNTAETSFPCQVLPKRQIYEHANFIVSHYVWG